MVFYDNERKQVVFNFGGILTTVGLPLTTFLFLGVVKINTFMGAGLNNQYIVDNLIADFSIKMFMLMVLFVVCGLIVTFGLSILDSWLKWFDVVTDEDTFFRQWYRLKNSDISHNNEGRPVSIDTLYAISGLPRPKESHSHYKLVKHIKKHTEMYIFKIAL
ncbi:MAG: hypothetical protein KAS32_09385 [Candidatus Peribacteraceae bacterium]|nr:hypothetical protein [Candidatus Peribacteraceae bacterium]